MRRYAWTLAVAAVIAVPGWAAAQGREAKASQGAADARVASKSAEVSRLERDVASAEAKSREADRKMEAQDQAIADLRRQLEQLKGSRAASGKGP